MKKIDWFSTSDGKSINDKLRELQISVDDVINIESTRECYKIVYYKKEDRL